MAYGGADGLDPSLFGGAGPGEAEEWDGFRGNFGDWYRDPDDVVRGVTMAQDVPDPFGSSCFQGFADGDFYREADDVCKGLALGNAAPGAPFFEGPGADEGLGKLGGLGSAEECISQFCGGVEQFTEADAPPAAPSGPFAKLEGTTVFVSTPAPCSIGNALLNFLDKHAVATVTKVNRKKFAIKADAFVGNAMCSLKVRVYVQERGRYAVEFQQRSGDRFTYGHVYQMAAEWLEKRFVANAPTKLGMELAAVPPPPPPASDAEAVWEQASPLLALAADASRGDLQAEAAAALAEMAQDAQAAAGLCNGAAFEDFKVLVSSDLPEVAYPTARLLALLAARPEAKQCFADDELLSAIIGKVHSGLFGPPLQTQLAQVLAFSVPRCAAALSDRAAENVDAELIKALGSRAVAEAPRRTLQEVHFSVRCARPALPA